MALVVSVRSTERKYTTFSASIRRPGTTISVGWNPRPVKTRADVVPVARGSSALNVTKSMSPGMRVNPANVSLKATSTAARSSSPSGSEATHVKEKAGHVVSGGASASTIRNSGGELRIGKMVCAGVGSTNPSLSIARTSKTTAAIDSPGGIGRRIVVSRETVDTHSSSGPTEPRRLSS